MCSLNCGALLVASHILTASADGARLVLALWAVGSDEEAQAECGRLLELDAALGRKVGEAIERGEAFRDRLVALEERALGDPRFVALEVPQEPA